MNHHVPGPRKIDKFKPIVILIKGESCSGKSNVSYFLNKSENVKYFSLDEFTLDHNLNILPLSNKIKEFGNLAYLRIHLLEKYVMDNKVDFIKYCYNTSLDFNKEIFIFDGVYFNDSKFLDMFIEKFENKYKVWVMNPK